MRHNDDSKKLGSIYQLIMEDTAKALTPEQIAKQATPAGGKGGSKSAPKVGGTGGISTSKGGLAETNKEGEETEQPSSNDMDNIDSSGKDTVVDDPYVLKETEEGAPKQIEGEDGSKEGSDITGEAVEHFVTGLQKLIDEFKARK